MRSSRRRLWLLLLLLAGWVILRPLPSVPKLEGVLLDSDGPVAGARVRIQGNLAFVLTDARGRYSLPGSKGHGKRIAAWKEGYRIAGGAGRLRLEPLPQEDNEDYAWIDPTPNPGQPQACGNCHDNYKASTK